MSELEGVIEWGGVSRARQAMLELSIVPISATGATPCQLELQAVIDEMDPLGAGA